MPTLYEILRNRSNDYSSLEQNFRATTQKELISDHAIGTITKSATVVVPAYNFADHLEKCLLGIQRQTIAQNSPECIEVIIVDDGSQKDVGDCARDIKLPCTKSILRLDINRGRSFARNIGTAYANKEIVVYVDADVVLHPAYIEQHLIRHSICPEMILVGFKQNVDIGAEAITKERITGNAEFISATYTQDFRWHKDLSKFISPEESKTGIVEIFRETNGFKNFGNGRTIGTWDLPTMVVSNNMSVSRDVVCAVGGFDERFKGWGLEDTHLGAKLIAAGCFVVPCLCTNVYNIKHPPRVDSENKKAEMMANWHRYREFLKEEFAADKKETFLKKYRQEEVKIWRSEK